MLVRAVLSGGPAAQAGLRAEDIITKINGEAATSIRAAFLGDDGLL